MLSSFNPKIAISSLFRMRRYSIGEISMLLIILQSCGIRYFQGIGFVLLFIIILLNIREAFKFNTNDWLIIFIASAVFVFCSLKAPSKVFFYHEMSFFAAFLLIKSYSDKPDGTFQTEFYNVIKFIIINAFVGYLIYLVLPFIFIYKRWNYGYVTLGGIFNLTGSYIYKPYLLRNCGLLWEPGLLQMFVNMYLFLSIIYHKANLRVFALSLFLLLTCNSSAGYIILAVILFYYFFFYQKISLKYLLLVSIIGSLLSSIIIYDLREKFIGSKSTSGSARARDWTIGADLISSRPILGHGFVDEAYLVKNSIIASIEDEFFTNVFLDDYGLMAGGYTSGFCMFIFTFGIPIALFIVFNFLKTKLAYNFMSRLFFCSIILLTMLSEPISDTPLFYFIFLTGFMLSYKNDDELVPAYKLNY